MTKINRSVLSLILLFVCFSLKAQKNDTLFVRYSDHFSDSNTYVTDTLFRKTSFGPHYLFETSWITNSRNQLQALGYGLQAKSADSECVVKGIESGENKLTSIVKTDSTIAVKFEVASNCCYSFLCDMEIVDSTTLNLIYIDYGSICGCTCYHELTFELELEFFDEESKLNYNKLQFLTLNGELKTNFE